MIINSLCNGSFYHDVEFLYPGPSIPDSWGQNVRGDLIVLC
ncbi:hypothetical protein FOQG_05076 [Fusarium oxysporum f. sp. raphani 54005]|uniref:Uncharacterized protein n=3 Tax=Fusarium oxysporum TaxID=5507 RepID=X0CIA5_FUSOX|nr:hypothetical protein FOVG_01675 [Fusarium oxysporum f. sp. pisi HDV247]EXK93916.1 hypothetical protein FOQG_05076 [Fusarium oxysporum f. sp. raphani 54005]EXL87563.1 hypothetical protein FOPG_01237 [Fusarium oxysporum f. sp. conglutinans race 2 54008]